MAVEIERKFLAVAGPWQQQPGTAYCQGYLNRNQHRTVRVRTAGNRGYLTVKGVSQGATRQEFEYEIPHHDAQQMLDELCERPLIEKTRYRFSHAGKTWEVDEFGGDNAGLIIAEIELDRETEKLDLPEWVGAEVTDDARYYNAKLVSHPYSGWSRK